MSIDLVCYSSVSLEEVKEILELMAAQHRGLFARRFLISRIDDLRNPTTYSATIPVEIALEHGMRASCSFRVALNDKSAADLLPTVEAIIKSALGASNVLILFNNEEPR
jgi:hypothetical protein